MKAPTVLVQDFILWRQLQTVINISENKAGSSSFCWVSLFARDLKLPAARSQGVLGFQAFLKSSQLGSKKIFKDAYDHMGCVLHMCWSKEGFNEILMVLH